MVRVFSMLPKEMDFKDLLRGSDKTFPVERVRRVSVSGNRYAVEHLVHLGVDDVVRCVHTEGGGDSIKEVSDVHLGICERNYAARGPGRRPQVRQYAIEVLISWKLERRTAEGKHRDMAGMAVPGQIIIISKSGNTTFGVNFMLIFHPREITTFCTMKNRHRIT